MIHVYNSHTEDFTSKPNNYYIGRPSILGNPFSHNGVRSIFKTLTFKTREEAVEAYSRYFDEMYGKDPRFTEAVDEIYEHYKNGEEIYLQCFCKPLPCHGDVIADKLQRRLIKEKMEEIKKYKKQYLREHNQEIKIKSKKYREEHKEEIKTALKEYHKAHREEHNIRSRKYYEANKKEILSKQKEKRKYEKVSNEKKD